MTVTPPLGQDYSDIYAELHQNGEGIKAFTDSAITSKTFSSYYLSIDIYSIVDQILTIFMIAFIRVRVSLIVNVEGVI